MREKIANGIERREGKIHIRLTWTCPRTGKRRDKKRRFEDMTNSEAILKRRELLAEAMGGEPEAQKRARMTVRDYSEQWIARQSTELGAGTVRKVIGNLSNHILPELGDYYCDALLRQDVLDLRKTLKEKTKRSGAPLARATILTIWSTAVDMLRDMRVDLDLERDCTERVSTPTVKRAPVRERRTLTLTQLHRCVELARQIAPERHAEILTLAYTGIRIGELYGLQWPDVDAGEECLRIRRSHTDGVLTPGGKTGEPRTPYAPPEVFEELERVRKEQLATQHPGLAQGWVFPQKDGRPRSKGSLRKAFRLISDEMDLGISIGPQVLRRSFITEMERSARMLDIRSQVGHHSNSTTYGYTFVSQERKKNAVEAALRRG